MHELDWTDFTLMPTSRGDVNLSPVRAHVVSLDDPEDVSLTVVTDEEVRAQATVIAKAVLAAVPTARVIQVRRDTWPVHVFVMEPTRARRQFEGAGRLAQQAETFLATVAATLPTNPTVRVGHPEV